MTTVRYIYWPLYGTYSDHCTVLIVTTVRYIYWPLYGTYSDHCALQGYFAAGRQPFACDCLYTTVAVSDSDCYLWSHLWCRYLLTLIGASLHEVRSLLSVSSQNGRTNRKMEAQFFVMCPVCLCRQSSNSLFPVYCYRRQKPERSQRSKLRILYLTLRSLTLYIYGAPILDVSRSHTTTQHSR